MSRLGLLPAGQIFTEEARPPIIPEYPRASEQTAFALTERGVRASVVRPARCVHGLGERHGFIPQLSGVARDKGVSAFVEDGQSPLPAVHRLDAARVYRLALERSAGNEAYHPVAEGVPFRLVAEAIGRQIGAPTKSLTAEQAETHFGDLAIWVMGSGPVSSEKRIAQTCCCFSARWRRAGVPRSTVGVHGRRDQAASAPSLISIEPGRSAVIAGRR